MTDIVTPKVVRNASPAPLTSDPPQIFDDKCIALASWYQGFIDDLNLATGHTNQNAQATHEFADAVQLLWQQVQDGVITIQQAMAAIQAGPVVSVMGRSGVVTGLVETASASKGGALMSTAPLGQWATFSSSGVAGGDWPTSQGIAWWNVFTFGTATRATQRATQVYAGGQQGWVYERQLHDAVWSRWRRVITDGAVIEMLNENGSATGSLAVSSDLGSAFYLFLTGNVALSIPAPRAGLDQFTFMIGQGGSHSVTWSANVRAPVGGIPSIPTGYVQTITLYSPSNSLNLWLAALGPRHPLS